MPIISAIASISSLASETTAQTIINGALRLLQVMLC